ncbi:IS110 family transposase, partial [Escherichia coli]|nr:IS110 family transposase [Escherichia coli]
ADWVRDLLCRKSNFVVTCALANKLARIAWALTGVSLDIENYCTVSLFFEQTYL